MLRAMTSVESQSHPACSSPNRMADLLEIQLLLSILGGAPADAGDKLTGEREEHPAFECLWSGVDAKVDFRKEEKLARKPMDIVFSEPFPPLIIWRSLAPLQLNNPRPL